MFCHSFPFLPTVFILPFRLTFTPLALSERLEQAMLTRVPLWGWWDYLEFEVHCTARVFGRLLLCQIAFTLTRPPLLETGSFQ